MQKDPKVGHLVGEWKSVLQPWGTGRVGSSLVLGKPQTTCQIVGEADKPRQTCLPQVLRGIYKMLQRFFKVCQTRLMGLPYLYAEKN